MERKQCPFADEQINKTGYIHTLEYYLACDGSFYVNLTGRKAPTLNIVVCGGISQRDRHLDCQTP